MFGYGIKLFTIFGFQIKLDMSWLILAALVTWSLAKGLFPFYYQGFANSTYWWMGVAGTLGLFASIVLHELAHSLVARNYGIPLKGITLFIFGGVAEMTEEPRTARSELLMAAAGPAMSIVLGGFLYGSHLMATGTWPAPIDGVVAYLGFINLLLAAFNLIPAFPLDGGRMLRSALWSWRGNLRWATRISSRIGSAFGILLMIVGVLRFVMGDFVGGIWMFLIGIFLRNVSQNSYQHLLVRNVLEGEPVRRFMHTDPVTVSPDITVRQLVDDYVYKHHFKVYPVVHGSQLVSCVSTREVQDVPRDQWERRRVRDVANSCSPDNTIRADDDAMKALSKMNRTGNSRLLVTDNGHLVGILALKDMLDFLSLKIDLEDN